MNENERSQGAAFDGIARILASGMPRRKVLGVLAGGAATMLLPKSLLMPWRAQGATPARRGKCTDDPVGAKVCFAGTCCTKDEECCGPEIANVICCETVLKGESCCVALNPDGSTKSVACCPAGQVCCKGVCIAACPAGQECCEGTGKCCKINNPDGSTCNAAGCCNPAQSSATPVPRLQASSPVQVKITVQNPTNGISKIAVVTAVNANINIPTFSPGTKAIIEVLATKIDQSKSAQIVLQPFEPGDCDPATQTCPMCPADPVLTTLQLTRGRWVRQTFGDIPGAEHYITVTNGKPGLHRLRVQVNGRLFPTLFLQDGQTKTLNVASAMKPGGNVITLIGYGRPGPLGSTRPGSAVVLIADAPNSTSNLSRSGASESLALNAAAALSSAHLRPRHAYVWGNLLDEAEDESAQAPAVSLLSVSANVSTQSVQLNFTGALEATTASDEDRYDVEVNGRAVAVHSARYEARTSSVTLNLGRRALRAGDEVAVRWERLRDAEGREVAGATEPLKAR